MFCKLNILAVAEVKNETGEEEKIDVTWEEKSARSPDTLRGSIFVWLGQSKREFGNKNKGDSIYAF